MKPLLSRRDALLGGLTLVAGCRSTPPPNIRLDEFQKRKHAGDPFRIACIGDSITYGSGIEDREKNCYPARLGDLLGSTFKVGNFGHSGATLSKTGDHPYWTTEEFMAATNSSPDVVLSMLGTNDTKPQNWHGEKEFSQDLGLLIEHFRRLTPKPMIWICLPPPVFKDEGGINAETLNNGVIPATMTECNLKKAPIIDLTDALIRHPEMFPDGVHPNAAGAVLMARTIYQAIRP